MEASKNIPTQRKSVHRPQAYPTTPIPAATSQLMEEYQGYLIWTQLQHDFLVEKSLDRLGNFLLTPVCDLLSCTEQKQDTYPAWLMEYDASFVLPDVPAPLDSAIPPCTCYLSPEGKPIIWIKKKSIVDTVDAHTEELDLHSKMKGGRPMDP